MEKVIPSHLVNPLTIQLNGLVMALEPIVNYPHIKMWAC